MKIIEEFYGSVDEVQSLWAEIYNSLKSKNYDTTTQRQAIDQSSLDTLNINFAFVLDLLYSLRPEKDESASAKVFSLRIGELQSRVGGLKTAFQPILKQMRLYARESVVLKDINNNFNFQFVENVTVVANANLSTYFSQIITNLRGLLGDIGSVFSLCQATGIGDLANRSEALAQLIQEIGNLHKKAIDTAKETEASAVSASKYEKGIKGILDSAQADATLVKNVKSNSEQELAVVNSLIAQIKTIGAASTTLDQQISAYKAKFDVFQSQMEERLKQFASFEVAIKEVDEQNKKSNVEIDRLISKADTMIRGATTAGLSKSLEDAREAYASKMAYAQFGFFIAIVFLTVSSLPLAAHLLPGMFGEYLPHVVAPRSEGYVDILGRVLLLLPATWLTVFFTKSYAEYFHLEREYSHKAALAKSVEGFKREAPKYQEEITSSVFGEILNNPSSRKSPEPANHPLYEVVTKRLFDWFGAKK